MKNRIAQFLVAELFAFGAFVTGGLAIFGGAATLNGASRHPQPVSWAIATGFGCVALVLAKTAVHRFKSVFVQPS